MLEDALHAELLVSVLDKTHGPFLNGSHRTTFEFVSIGCMHVTYMYYQAILKIGTLKPFEFTSASFSSKSRSSLIDAIVYVNPRAVDCGTNVSRVQEVYRVSR